MGLVGSGNNGGDTLVALANLKRKGWSVKAYIAKARAKDDPLISAFLNMGGEIFNASDDLSFRVLKQLVNTSEVILDGILGTGIDLPLKESIAAVL